MKFTDFLSKASGFLNDKVRPLIDGENLDQVIINSNSAHNQAEDFLAKVSQIIANIMKENKFIIPNGKVYLPSEYVVFLSPEKDKEWQGKKRLLFIEGLEVLSHEYACSICGKTALDLNPMKVELRVDGTLAGNSAGFRVQAVLDETKTSTNDVNSPSQTTKTKTLPIDDDEKTVVYYDDEMTVVYDNEKTVVEVSPLYYLEILRQNKLQDKFPITKREIKIGRPSKTSSLDISLPNNKISRNQATLIVDEANRIWLIHQGQNPTKIEGVNCTNNIRTLVKYNQKIEMEDFVLIIRN